MDGFVELAVFTRVVAARSFTAAGRSLGMSPSGVSRVIARLEQRLRVRLLQRTTRSLSLTDDGAAYHARCVRILAELDDAESALALNARTPRGRLRVDAPTVIVRHLIAPALPAFLAAHPELAIDLSARDHVIDPSAEGVDVTLRLAPLRDSELIARIVGRMRMVIAASPRYLRAHGRPRHPDDLANHQLIGFLTARGTIPWRFTGGRERPVAGRLCSNSDDAAREAALAGMGLVKLFEVQLARELARGRLVAVLEEHAEAPRPVYALYARQSAASAKVRVFLEWVAARF